MPKSRYRRESRPETANRIIEDLQYNNIRHHIAYNRSNTPRYIIIDIGQNQRDIRE